MKTLPKKKTFSVGKLFLATVAAVVSIQAASAEIKVSTDFPVGATSEKDATSALVSAYRRDVEPKTNETSKSAPSGQQTLAAASGN